MYGKLIASLSRDPDRTIILVNLEAITISSLHFHMPTQAQFADAVANILAHHHFSTCSIVAHSFGTISAGWLIRRHPSMVCHLTLIDPVSLLLALPDVAFNFLYRAPSLLSEWYKHQSAKDVYIFSFLFTMLSSDINKFI